MSSTSVFPVRRATVRDAKAIAALHNATVKEAFKGMLGDVDVPIMALDKRQAYWRELAPLCNLPTHQIPNRRIG